MADSSEEAIQLQQWGESINNDNTVTQLEEDEYDDEGEYDDEAEYDDEVEYDDEGTRKNIRKFKSRIPRRYNNA